mgnify:CR=1 FL=1
MATMKLYELVNHYHIGTELTCAEAMFMACNEYYHLNLSEETRKMFSVMGLGMQTEQSCCGAFTVAVGIIGLMTAKEGQTDVSNMEGYQMIAELTEFMLGFYGTLHCVELQRLEIVGVENPCHAIVEALAKKLDISPVPVIIAIAVSSNLQGAATLVGDTTSILLGGYAGMNFLDFFVFRGRPGIFSGGTGGCRGIRVRAAVLLPKPAPAGGIR